MDLDLSLVYGLEPATLGLNLAEAGDIDGGAPLVLLLMALQRTPGITGAQVDSLLATLDRLAVEYIGRTE